MERTDPNIAQKLSYLLPELECRTVGLRAMLEELAEGKREWGIDIDVAICDVRILLDLLTFKDPEDDEDEQD